LREKLLQLWKPIDQWKMIPLGRVFLNSASLALMILEVFGQVVHGT
jgi:hypothetical protein